MLLGYIDYVNDIYAVDSNCFSLVSTYTNSTIVHKYICIALINI